DLLINLVCPSDIILSRIAKRGRDFEASVDLKYVMALNDEVQCQVQYVERSMSVVHVDAAKYDFEKRHEDVTKVLAIICENLGLPVAAATVPRLKIA
ncbi:MAG: deoxynucleoside kinase, partial [Proteobacteria bacterium]|nr:deoxynucleoside kinase [Pseudomonadota bacterium]